MKTIVYVDAFNLYYGSLKNTPYRWLDLAALCERLLPRHELIHIKYYTALVKDRPHNPGQAARQQAYLRALRTLPNLSITLGHYLSHKVRMPLAQPTTAEQFATVIKTEEKGSDVNLAAHMLSDGYEDCYESAVVISNDSDLLEPVKIVGEKLGKMVGVLNPQRRPSRELHAHAHFFKQIRQGVLKDSQFPPVLTDSKGKFHKPSLW